ncbi:hypothetical protein [Marinoscillum sp. 108]|uniref:hypothetical protein n=1 Tax=Marinoscillum sp. 108 TaxID=2653151 RepID=UPI0013585967|nr:hypothetical protein [Marinoscillum sp. 108]
MRTIYFKRLMLLAMVLFSSLLISCGEDDGPKEPEVLLPNLDGLYVYGTSTVAAEPGGAASKINLAILDPGQGAQVESMDGVFGKFIHIGANSTISFAYVSGGEGVVYGADGGGSLDSANTVGGVINDKVIHGTLVQDADPINVTNAGLYYVFVNINTESFTLMEVKANMIGDATELQWSAGTALALKSSDNDKTVFEGTGLALTGATGYRYRFNDGWHVYSDETIVTLSSLGVPSYGDAWDSGINDLGFYLDNIPHKETGIFTVTLTYTASTGEWEEVKTKTGDLENDYSSLEIGWFGNAYLIDGAEPSEQWGTVHLVKTPTKDLKLYNWTWTIELIEDRSFVLRDPDGTVWITHGGAAKVGGAFDDGDIIKEEGQDNYFVVTPGIYEVTFTINSEDDGRTLTMERTTQFPDYSDKEYGIFGNAYYVEGTTEGAWEAIHHIKTPEKDGNKYNWTWTLELIEGRSFVFRENAENGEWVTYGGAAKIGEAFESELIIKEDGQDNYYVATGGNYDITFTINAEDEGRILNIVPAQ